VVCRFLTWRPAVSAAAQTYMQAVRAHPLMQRWYAEAAREPAEWKLAKYEKPVA
jgi:glutathione S-transferase